MSSGLYVVHLDDPNELEPTRSPALFRINPWANILNNRRKIKANNQVVVVQVATTVNIF
jgi:hypothetical protein